jgi:hypothetical protein
MAKTKIYKKSVTPAEAMASLLDFDLFAVVEADVEIQAPVPEIIVPALPHKAQRLQRDKFEPVPLTDEIWDAVASHG